MTVDMSKYLSLFVSDSADHLEALARDLVQLEKDASAAVVDSMFRHAHSVKGMAASMGFESIAILAHRVEDVVHVVRTDRSKITSDLVDLLLSATDSLQAQVRLAAESKPFEDVSLLIQKLGERFKALTGEAPAPTRIADATIHSHAGGASVKTPLIEATTEASGGATVRSAATPEAPRVAADRFRIKLKISPQCRVPGVRAFLVHKRLSGLGVIVSLKPPLDDLKAGRISEGLVSVHLETTSDEAAILQALRNISDVDVVEVKSGDSEAPTQPPKPKQDPAKVAQQESTTRTVKVRTELLDYLLDAVGELLLATARIREIGKKLPGQARSQLDEGVDRIHGLAKDLHDRVISVRMTPLSVITDRLPRVARDICRRRGREVELAITGAEIELDRAILDELSDPLLHILRNCIDHGIESADERAEANKPSQGNVVVNVRRNRDRVELEIQDDGRGMDGDKLRAAAVAQGAISPEAARKLTDKEAFMLCCLPGVSTAKDVSEISGRGVGMDAVKRAVENVGGTLEIDSELGRGTQFKLSLPLTVAVINLLLVRVGEEIFGLPIGKVLGAVEFDESKLSVTQQMAFLPQGHSMVPIQALATLLGVPEGARTLHVPRPYVLMESESGKVALAVDQLLGQEEVVLKALSRPLDMVIGLGGVTILGSGRPVFILDVPRLVAA